MPGIVLLPVIPVSQNSDNERYFRCQERGCFVTGPYFCVLAQNLLLSGSINGPKTSGMEPRPHHAGTPESQLILSFFGKSLSRSFSEQTRYLRHRIRVR